MTELKIVFPNAEAANHFMRWLDGQGEQDYWIWMEEQEPTVPGTPIVVREFLYPCGDDQVDSIQIGTVMKST